MSLTLEQLQEFYQSPLGEKVEQQCAAAIARFTPPAKTERVMGFGYTTPYLEAFAKDVDYCQVFIPTLLIPHDSTCKHDIKNDTPSAKHPENVLWAKTAQQALAEAKPIAEEHKFPLKDDTLDCILAIHSLEFSPNARAQLHELWRVLAPNGRLILIVPNRRGLWAHIEQTPFGHGQPYSPEQLAEALQQNNFVFKKIYELVHYLPNKKHHITFISDIYQKVAKNFFPYFGGVLIVEATKQLYNPLIEANKTKRPALMPNLMPQATSFTPQHYSKFKK